MLSLKRAKCSSDRGVHFESQDPQCMHTRSSWRGVTSVNCSVGASMMAMQDEVLEPSSEILCRLMKAKTSTNFLMKSESSRQSRACSCLGVAKIVAYPCCCRVAKTPAVVMAITQSTASWPGPQCPQVAKTRTTDHLPRSCLSSSGVMFLCRFQPGTCMI